MTPVSRQKYLEYKDFADISPEVFSRIARIMKNARGFDLDGYKDQCIKRRIAIRLRATNCSSGEEYCELLRRDDDEVDRLQKVLTIHVSQFFRDPPMFEKLCREILPHLFALSGMKGSERLGIWSVGCAGGEEPYTVALLLKRFFPDERKLPSEPKKVQLKPLHQWGTCCDPRRKPSDDTCW